jgi:hypothetical protein
MANEQLMHPTREVLVGLVESASRAPSYRRLDWIHAGEALEHVLLHAAGHGVQAGFLNQPCQVDQLRTRLADLINRDGSPQLILRLGRPLKPLPAAPRRRVHDVIDHD